MKKWIKLLALFFITVILASGFAITASAEIVSQSNVKSSSIIYVPDEYAKIQWAVDNASAGDIIIVRDGTYVENVEVDKSLTIRSENGSAHTIVHPANLTVTESLFAVTANYVNIFGIHSGCYRMVGAMVPYCRDTS